MSKLLGTNFLGGRNHLTDVFWGVSDLRMSPAAGPGSPLGGCGHSSDHASVVALGSCVRRPFSWTGVTGHRSSALSQKPMQDVEPPVVLNSAMTSGSFLKGEQAAVTSPRGESPGAHAAGGPGKAAPPPPLPAALQLLLPAEPGLLHEARDARRTTHDAQPR